jgi:hypothetical protein
MRRNNQLEDELQAELQNARQVRPGGTEVGLASSRRVARRVIGPSVARQSISGSLVSGIISS